MSDKSFGDHTFRSVVKNSLLSNAVTGLSIEDLTHNAVLLPVAQTQGETVEQDQTTTVPKHSLGHNEYSTPNLPSGDSNSNILATDSVLNNNRNTLSFQQNVRIQKNNDFSSSTLSKASVKTEDDFDVNEYFARLHGTRYVSAPLQSLQKDQNANLEDTEENLEEINLNEPDKSLNDDNQQSLTADIAQNFSQLPTMLPQVASAVFSSFSNMLSLKSRDVTPDEGKSNTVSQEVPAQRADIGPPPTTMQDLGARDIPPPPRTLPPKEPPTGGIGYYRIGTKKKAYAQIPGLCSGDTSQKPYVQNITNSQTYFVPDVNVNVAVNDQNIFVTNPSTEFYNPLEAPKEISIKNLTVTKENDQICAFDANHATENDSICNPAVRDAEVKSSNFPASDSQINFVFDRGSVTDLFPSTVHSIEASQHSSQTIHEEIENVSSNASTFSGAVDQNQTNTHSVLEYPIQASTSIIPPPPMFSNLTKKDSVEKSILPPSIARRFVRKQPEIKSECLSVTLPEVISDTPVTSANPMIKSQSIEPPTGFLSFTVPDSYIPVTSATPEIKSQSTQPPIACWKSQSPEPPMGRLSFTMPDSYIPVASATPEIKSQSIEPLMACWKSQSTEPPTGCLSFTMPDSYIPVTSATALTASNNVPRFTINDSLQNISPTPNQSTLSFHDIPTQTLACSMSEMPKHASTSIGLPAQSFVNPASLQLQQQQHINFPPPPFFNPNTVDSINKNTSDSEIIQNRQINVSEIFTTTSESTKRIPEPPKLTGSNTNFRMNKKKPQYYAGPIQGVGAISNNVKPIIPEISSSIVHAPQCNIFNQSTFLRAESYNQVANDEADNDLSIRLSTVQEANNLSNNELNMQPNYNTIFDLSRQTTECYEEPKQDSKGFGLIGSLKWKLSSIDINKIQNSVTTFFDPSYNDTKKDTSNIFENVPYGEKPNVGYKQTELQGIIVPNTDACSVDQNKYISRTPLYNCNQNNQYYQDANNQPNFGYFSDSFNHLVQQPSIETNLSTPPSKPDHPPGNYISNTTTSNNTYTSTSTDEAQETMRKQERSLSIPQTIISVKQTENIPSNKPNIPDKRFFDQHDVLCAPVISKSDELNEQLSTLRISQDSKNKHECLGENLIIIPLENNDTHLPLSENVSQQLCVSDTERKEDYFSNFSSDFRITYPNNVRDKGSVVAEDKKQTTHIGFKENVSTSDVSSESLPSISNILADSKETIEIMKAEMNKVCTEDNVKEVLKDNSANIDGTLSNFYIRSDVTTPELGDKFGSVSDLNICETCREVKKPEERESDNLTDQLIENITAPIQLSNPVVVPLNEDKGSDEKNTNQSAEISLKSEDENLESLFKKIASRPVLDKSVFELKSFKRLQGRDAKQINFVYPPIPHPSTVPISKDVLNKIIKFPFDSNNPRIDPNILLAYVLHELGSPSAPPAEDDDENSDETGGIDVRSIEQDATKDFPIYEEFVIEPSETDDSKIECIESEKSNYFPDTFANRIEKFKKMDKSSSAQNDMIDAYSDVLHLQTTSPVIPLASYFDTGNYAVETHYRNCQNSPTVLTSITGIPMRVPPGFEEEYQKRLSSISEKIKLTKSLNKVGIVEIPDCTTQTKMTTTVTYNLPDKIKTVPDTSTQTRPINTVTFSQVDSSKAEDIAISSDPINILVQEPKQDLITEFTSVSNVSRKGIDEKSHFEKNDWTTPTEVLDPVQNLKLEELKTSESVKMFDTATKSPPLSESDRTSCQLLKKENSNSFNKPREDTAVILPNLKPAENVEKESGSQTLPDGINFFSNTSSNQEYVDSGFNRLASYFSSPTKTDPAKSFFELSQSQNHYRHVGSNEFESHLRKSDRADQNIFFQKGQNENHYKENIDNISQEKYVANLDLMRDLTSYDNLNVGKDHKIRTVNYFTVEYDVIKTDLNKGEPDTKRNKCDKQNLSDDAKYGTDTREVDADETTTDDVWETIIKTCKYCCNFITVSKTNINFVSVGNVKVREVMDYDNREPSKEKELNMGESRENSRRSTTIDVESYNSDKDSENVSMLAENRSSAEYTPVKHHWFYRVDCEGKSIWRGFSSEDSRALENAFHSLDLNEHTLVPTDGGRYDVNVIGRLRTAVYWPDKPTNVRRCSWFYKGTTDARYVPYTESIADKLEEEYRHGITTGEWHRRLSLPNNEMVVMHGPGVMVHFLHGATTDAFSTPNLLTFGKRVYRSPLKIRVAKDTPERVDHLLLLVHGAGEWRSQKEKIQSTTRPKVVRRGIDESEIEDTEPSHIDHLLLLCHGVGSACDMRFRAVEEVVDDFRATSLQLLQSHYRNAYDSGVVSRIEVLPISWHATLHSGETGVDRRLAQITLESIPRLRSFTNDTVLDVLFYTSPIFCQTIIDTVCKELNRIYNLFRKRNPSFNGGVSLGGHSLGSVILYDLLCHQTEPLHKVDVMDDKKYVIGAAGTGQPTVRYPTLDFAPAALYALGSPIAIFECIRGVESLGMHFSLPTCKNFFNIFHPYDPIAYRIEPLINSHLKNLKPFLIPHHKGRKRMHLELKDTMARVGADLKQKVVESIKATWASVWRSQPPPSNQLEKVVEEEIEKEKQELEETKEEPPQVNDVTPDMLGKLNSGRRVDYVLQEAPFEMINEYLFAMTSHVGYWESEDTMLMILREIYDALGVSPDCTVPPPGLTVRRTRNVTQDETIVLNASDNPSTSRGST